MTKDRNARCPFPQIMPELLLSTTCYHVVQQRTDLNIFTSTVSCQRHSSVRTNPRLSRAHRCWANISAFRSKTAGEHVPVERKVSKRISESERELRDSFRRGHAAGPFTSCFTDCKSYLNCRFLSQFLPLDVPRNFAFYWRLSGECRLFCARSPSFLSSSSCGAGRLL